MVETIIGSVGVGLLLIAFVLNLRRQLTEHSATYLLLNILGSALAAVYAFMMDSIPFIVLEGVWAGAAALRLLDGNKKGSSE